MKLSGIGMSLQVVDMIGFAASIFVFITFYMRTLLSLRMVAIISNIAFIAYGFTADLLPILILHLLLLPMNVWRTVQQLKANTQMRSVLEKAPETNFLMPFMTVGHFPVDEVIFNKDDAADRFYVVVKGEVEVEEFGKIIPKGGIFGEMGLFSLDSKRTATVRSKSPVTLAWIDREAILRIYRNHPDFALALTKLIASRLIENQKVLLARLPETNT